MVANLCLLTCALLTGQATDRPEWQLLPRLARGQELVYRGSLVEETLDHAIQFSRSYRVETRVFVLQTSAQGMEVAFLTILKLRPGRSERGDDAPSSVRLEQARVDLQGRIVADAGVSLAVPVEGPTTVECGAFVEWPRGPVRLEQSWAVTEEGRPLRTWRVLGTEAINGIRCLKLEGLQQSDDWEQPRADHSAWRRRDLVWLTPRLGAAQRVERTWERREPARREPTQRTVMRYDLESSIPFPGQLYEDRRQEIQQARTLAETAAPLLPNPARYSPQTWDALLAKLTQHLDTHPPTPYREAVLQVKRRVEAARRGEVPPTMASAEAAMPPLVAALGQRAPDFLATNLLTGVSARLRHWQGRPVVMVFYHPASSTATDLLRFAQDLQEAHRQEAGVVGLSVSDDAKQVRQQQMELGLTFPILAGKGLRQTFTVEATPKLIVLDADGVVRIQLVGWGQETPEAVTHELLRWLRKGDGTPSPTQKP